MTDAEVRASLAQNPYPRDGGLHTARSLDLRDALSAFWRAGASLDEIAYEVRAALTDVATNVTVTITPV